MAASDDGKLRALSLPHTPHRHGPLRAQRPPARPRRLQLVAVGQPGHRARALVVARRAAAPAARPRRVRTAS
ncbi:hypothetical protein OPT61_g10272 [Boeremia exigua]|uniref:Uncharacterized protein n=1 Tax=Boeremia exigua TaxID=749465 RepID=A0ACC2HQF3_9PLEO|nr:hypothetical protein OPT61_g10272 [Boeremia exigua]